MRAWSHVDRRRSIRGTLVVSLLLSSCGGDGSDTTASVPVANTPPAAVPTPPPSPTPTPTATPAPAPVPSPTATPELYTLGTMTWSFANGIPDDRREAFADGMDWAINQINTITNYYGNVPVVYGSGTPTADAGYLGQVRFGGSWGRDVALHEMAHWLGSGSIGAWPGRVVDGRFTGPITDTRIKAFEGPAAVMNADWAHFWPYGFNSNGREEPQRNISLVAAQRADMGLSDGVYYITGDRRFLNRSSRQVLDAGAAVPVQSPFGDASSLTWRVSFVDGFVILTNAATGRVIDSLGGTDDGAATGMRAPSGQPEQQWEMIPTDTGWFQLRNRATRKCLDNMGETGNGTAIRVWSCWGHPNQHWHLIR